MRLEHSDDAVEHLAHLLAGGPVDEPQLDEEPDTVSLRKGLDALLRELAVLDGDERAIERADAGGAQPDALDRAYEVVNRDEVSLAQRLVDADGEGAEQVLEGLLRGQGHREAADAEPGQDARDFAAIQLAQTTTRAVIGTLDLDRTFEERDIINASVIKVLNEVSAGWGIEVKRYEVKHIVPPPSVKNAMERQMGAERDRRSLVARAEGDHAARINDSEGKKQEFINRSEGEMQCRVNGAQGKAQEIVALAQATADSIRTVGQALIAEGGAEAVNLKIAQPYVQ